MTTQNNNDSLAGTASDQQHEISDNGSIILGWLVIAIMIVFGALSVATHDAEIIDMVESGAIKSTVNDSDVQNVIHPIEENKPKIIIENEDNLIPTRILI